MISSPATITSSGDARLWWWPSCGNITISWVNVTCLMIPMLAWDILNKQFAKAWFLSCWSVPHHLHSEFRVYIDSRYYYVYTAAYNKIYQCICCIKMIEFCCILASLCITHTAYSEKSIRIYLCQCRRQDESLLPEPGKERLRRVESLLRS